MITNNLVFYSFFLHGLLKLQIKLGKLFYQLNPIRFVSFIILLMVINLFINLYNYLYLNHPLNLYIH